MQEDRDGRAFRAADLAEAHDGIQHGNGGHFDIGWNGHLSLDRLTSLRKALRRAGAPPLGRAAKSADRDLKVAAAITLRLGARVKGQF